MPLETKVIVITGATSGIGLSLLERLLLETKFQFLLHICILCRNMTKGEFVRSTLLLSHKTAQIDLVKMDTGDIKSVLKASEVLKKKFTHIDFLYLNAGILPIKRLNLMALFSKDVAYRLKTGEFILEHDNPVDAMGVPAVFSTNTLGHFVLFQEVVPLLRSDGSTTSKVIWTTSNNAIKDSFSMDDFMCRHGSMPYGSSKYIINGLSVAMNKMYNKEGIVSCLAEPGLCITGINGSFIPGWLWKLVEIAFMMLRILMNHLTLSTYNGSECLVWLFRQDPHQLEKNHQYESQVTVFNQPYIKNTKLEMSISEADEIYEKMCEVTEQIKEKVEC